jgi:hypothetical protein
VSRHKAHNLSGYFTLRCFGCFLRISSGESYYSVTRGYKSTLNDVIEEEAEETWHAHCLDLYSTILNLVPEESLILTMHEE